MDSPPSVPSSASASPSYPDATWFEHAVVFFFRPLLAVLFVLSLIVLSWYVAWKAVLVHVPLVQEIFGLRKKPVRPRPRNTHRLSRFYKAAAASSRDSRISAADAEATNAAE